MTTFLTILDGWDIAAIVVGAWLIFACVVAVPIGRAMRKPDPKPEVVNWIPFLPPVPAPITPPLSQTVPSADWFFDIPSECLGDDAVRALCDDIERREFS